MSKCRKSPQIGQGQDVVTLPECPCATGGRHCPSLHTPIPCSTPHNCHLVLSNWFITNTAAAFLGRAPPNHRDLEHCPSPSPNCMLRLKGAQPAASAFAISFGISPPEPGGLPPVSSHAHKPSTEERGVRAQPSAVSFPKGLLLQAGIASSCYSLALAQAEHMLKPANAKQQSH